MESVAATLTIVLVMWQLEGTLSEWYPPPSPPTLVPPPPMTPSLITRSAVSVDVRVQELCESRGGRPGLSVLTSLTVSDDDEVMLNVLRCQLTY